MSDTPPPRESPGAVLLSISSMIRLERALWAAAELGVADHLPLPASGDPPVAVDTLAGALGVDRGALYRVLRGLASVGIFTESAGGRFSHTELSSPLRSDSPDSVRQVILQHGGEAEWRAWGEILHSVRTGRPAFAEVWGESPWGLYEETRDRMTQMSRRDSAALASHPLFAGAGHVVDVAGGEGDFLAAVLQANPVSRGTLFDRPTIVATAPVLLEAAGVADRCVVLGGDMFESVPAGGDLYLLKRTLHDWDDERAAALLRSIATAMRGRGRLVILTAVIPPGDAPSSAKLSDLALMVMLGGRHRTEDELRRLLREAAFILDEVVELPSALSAVVAIPS